MSAIKLNVPLITDGCSSGQQCRVLIQPLGTAGLEAVLDVVVVVRRPVQVAVEKPRDLSSEDPVNTLLFSSHQTLEVTLPVQSSTARTPSSSSAVKFKIGFQGTVCLFWVIFRLVGG